MTSEGGAFFEMMKKQSQTAAGLWSTLQSEIANVLTEFGKPILGELKGFLTDGISATQGLIGKAKEFGQQIADSVAIARTLYQSGTLSDALGAGLKIAFQEAINLLLSGLGMAVSGLAAAMIPVAEGFVAVMEDGAKVIGARLSDALDQFNPKKMLDKLIIGDIPDMQPRRADRVGDAAAASSGAFSKFTSLFDVAQAKRDFAAIVEPARDMIASAREAMKPIGDAPKVELPKGAADTFTPEAKKGGSSRSNVNSLAKVGMYIGGSTPVGERHARDTASNTKAANGKLDEISRKMDRPRGANF